LFNESLEPTYTIGSTNAKNVHETKDEQCLFKSTFTNTTEREQEYSFKTERSTRSAATVIIEKGVCRGIEMSLKLKTPGEVVEANAGFNSELTVINIGENTIEEELTWGVDMTNIKDNNSLITIIEGKIADIIRNITNYSSLGFIIQNDVVLYTTKGTCKFKYGIEQKVKITEHPIRKY
uniref:TMEM132 domain-containing protein n=1 Tax=Brugia timori TaxID=42155 RepID=A0A0R3Q7U7_9BILA